MPAETQGNESHVDNHPSDEQILAVLDGTALYTIRAHVARCPACGIRADDLRYFERQLRQALYRALCPSTDELCKYAQRRLNPAQFIRITEHMIDCQECSNELQLLEDGNVISTFLEL